MEHVLKAVKDIDPGEIVLLDNGKEMSGLYTCLGNFHGEARFDLTFEGKEYYGKDWKWFVRHQDGSIYGWPADSATKQKVIGHLNMISAE